MRQQLSPLQIVTLSTLPPASSAPGAMVRVGNAFYWSDGTSWYQIALGVGQGASTFTTAKILRTSSLSVSASTWTTITYESKTWDTANHWSTGQPTRIIIPTAGYYTFVVRSTWAVATGTRQARLVVNGDTANPFAVYADYANSTTNLTAFIPTGTVVLKLNANDYVETQVFSTAATTLTPHEVVVTKSGPSGMLPLPPTNFQYNISGSSVIFTWTAGDWADQTYFKRNDDADGANYGTVQRTPDNSTFTENGLLPGHTASYEIWSVNALGTSPHVSSGYITMPYGGSSWVSLSQVSTSTNLPGPLRGVFASDHTIDGQTDQYQVPGYDYWDEHERVPIATFCPAQGVYNETTLINMINAAKSRNRAFLFAISATDDFNFNAWPTWMQNQISSSLSTYGSIWNAPVWMDTLQGLLAYLGNKVAQAGLMKWIRAIDIRVGGWFGEGHYGGSTAQGSWLTDSNINILTDAHINAFPGVQMLAMTDPGPDNRRYALDYAMGKSANIGWRRDSFSNPGGPSGNTDYGFNWITQPTFSQAARDRWQTAPVVVENFGFFGDYNNQNWDMALGQAQKFHISAFKDQNHGHPWNNVGTGTNAWASQADRDKWQQCWTQGGYRLGATDVNRPASAAVNSSISFGLKWANTGNCRLYVPHNVEIYLVSGGGAEVKKWTSGIVLTNILPGNTPTQTDTFSLSGVAAGSYDLRFRAVDAQGLPRRLMLTNANRLADGGYSVGSITIS